MGTSVASLSWQWTWEYVSLTYWFPLLRAYTQQRVCSYDSSIFSFLKKLHTVLQNDCSDLQHHKQCVRVLFSPHLFIFLIIANLTGMTHYFMVVLIYISLMIRDVEHFFISLLATYTSFILRNVCSGLYLFLFFFLLVAGIEPRGA